MPYSGRLSPHPKAGNPQFAPLKVSVAISGLNVKLPASEKIVSWVNTPFALQSIAELITLISSEKGTETLNRLFARVTLDALDAGAVDFLPKNFEDIARDSSRMQEVLKQRILAVAASGKKKGSSTAIRQSEPHKTQPMASSAQAPSE